MPLSPKLGLSAVAALLLAAACSAGNGGAFVGRDGNGTDNATQDPHIQPPTRSGTQPTGGCVVCDANYVCKDAKGNQSTLKLQTQTDGSCGYFGVSFACGGAVVVGGQSVATWTSLGSGFEFAGTTCVPGTGQTSNDQPPSGTNNGNGNGSSSSSGGTSVLDAG